MAKFHKVSLVVFVIQMSIQFSTSMYDIYRGNMDTFSRNIVHNVPEQCGDDEYCSCNYLETFTYSYDKHSHGKGKCVKDEKFRNQSRCEQFSYFDYFTGSYVDIAIQSVRQGRPTPGPVLFKFSAKGGCIWKSTNYTVNGGDKNWLPTRSNPGSISVFHTLNKEELKLQISNPGELLSRFAGMLLRLQIECSVSTESFEICLLLKIEGQTNITTNPVLPTSSPPDTTTFPDFPATSPTTISSSTSVSAPSMITPTNQVSAVPVKSQTEGLNTNTSPMTTKAPVSTTIIPSDSENDNREGDESDSSSLVPILVPILLSFVLIVVLFGVFLYRRRQRTMSTNIDKDFYDDNTLPHHAALTKTPQDSSHSYAVPGSQINTTPIYDTVYESTNVPHRDSPNHYEFEDDDYATCDDHTIPEVNRSHTDHISPLSSHTNPSTDIYQDIDFNQAPRSTANSKVNLGYLNQSNESSYYHSLEKDTSNENIYDRVAEDPQDPQEHIYNVLEKPN